MDVRPKNARANQYAGERCAREKVFPVADKQTSPMCRDISDMALFHECKRRSLMLDVIDTCNGSLTEGCGKSSSPNSSLVGYPHKQMEGAVTETGAVELEDFQKPDLHLLYGCYLHRNQYFSSNSSQGRYTTHFVQSKQDSIGYPTIASNIRNPS